VDRGVLLGTAVSAYEYIDAEETPVNALYSHFESPRILPAGMTEWWQNTTHAPETFLKVRRKGWNKKTQLTQQAPDDHSKTGLPLGSGVLNLQTKTSWSNLPPAYPVRGAVWTYIIVQAKQAAPECLSPSESQHSILAKD
jgi:hypothetical protein